MTVDVLLSPTEIAAFAGRTTDRPDACVVFDILRATTTIVAALAAGAHSIRPVTTIEEALALKSANPSLLLAGERNGNRISKFDLGNSPAEFAATAHRDIVTTTTNGTVALAACAGVPLVCAAAFLNMQATARFLAAARPQSLTILCAGTFETTALEDVAAAGALCAHFPHASLTDAARVAATVWTGCHADVAAFIRLARNARVLERAGCDADIEFALRMNSVDFAAVVVDGAVVREDALPPAFPAVAEKSFWIPTDPPSTFLA